MSSILFKVILISCFFLLAGCKEDNFIAGNYYHFKPGTIHATINRKNESKLDDIVVDSRVDTIIVIKDIIYVARRPTIYFKKDDTFRVKLTDQCELYAINILTDELKELPSEENVIEGLICIKES